MPIESQFSLSLELTKLVPLGPLASAVGHGLLALARDLKNTGSDILVEEDLVAVFGRNRIESHFESTFKTVVRESTTQQLGTFLDIVLNAGAGPTVQRSLKDSRYFSTVVQLSLLTSVYDIGSLAGGLSTALARRLDGAPMEQRQFPGAQALSGTLRACREQTSNFIWRLLFDAVSTTLGESGIIDSDHSSEDTGIATAVLQGLLDFLPMLQYFPEDRLVRIRLYRGNVSSTCLLVVWAHHVLGLSVQVQSEADSTTFGKGRIQVILEHTYDRFGEGICLFDQHDEEVLYIACDRLAPEILLHGFVPAYGCAKYWNYLEGKEPYRSESNEAMRLACASARYWLLVYGHEAYRARVRKATMFVYGTWFDPNDLKARLDEIDSMFDALDNEGLEVPNVEAYEVAREIVWVTTAFAFVDDLDMLRELPISRGGLSFSYAESRRVERGEPASTHRYPFFLMAGLLLGKDIYYSHVDKLCLASVAGWSMMTDVFTLPDPVHVRRGMIRVQRGVPTRAGEQKRFIYNFSGYRHAWTSISAAVPSPRRLASQIPAATPRWYVGVNENAFEVGIDFHFTRRLRVVNQLSPSSEPNSDGPRNPTQTAEDPICYFLNGLVDLENCVRRTIRLPPCQHLEDSLLGSLYEDSENCETKAIPLCEEDNQALKALKNDTILIIPSAGEKWSRWMAIQYADRYLWKGGPGNCKTFVRDPNGCPACAMNTARQWLDNQKPRGPNEVGHLAVIVL